jgi:phospholipid/cholesterol/gamma-HCH transport system substrate-binding protein
MKKYPMETAVGIFVLIGLIGIGYMTVKLGKVSFLATDTYPLFARFASASGLRVGSTVEVYGLEVGSVKGLSIDNERQMAVVEMTVNKKIKVYDDASVAIKTAGLIGDRYVKIDPGGSGEVLKPGSFIIQTSVPTDIEDLIGKYAFGDVKKGPEGPQGKTPK